MTRHIRRKSEFVRLSNERDFPHPVELTLPPEGFRDVLLQIGAFHRERRIPVRRGRSRYGAKPFYIRFTARVLDPRTGEAQAVDPRLIRLEVRCDSSGRRCQKVTLNLFDTFRRSEPQFHRPHS
jgi:hypothetical protein